MARVRTAIVMALALFPNNLLPVALASSSTGVGTQQSVPSTAQTVTESRQSTRRAIKEAGRLAKLRRMRELIEEEMAELDARDELDALADSIGEDAAATHTIIASAPTALASGIPVLDVDFVDDEAKPLAAVEGSISSRSNVNGRRNVIGNAVGTGVSVVAAASYRLGMEFAGTLMPYPMPSWMAGVHSYTIGRQYAPTPPPRAAASNATTPLRPLASVVGKAAAHVNLNTTTVNNVSSGSSLAAPASSLDNETVITATATVPSDHHTEKTAAPTAEEENTKPHHRARWLKTKLERIKRLRHNSGTITTTTANATTNAANATTTNTSETSTAINNATTGAVTTVVVPSSRSSGNDDNATPCFNDGSDDVQATGAKPVAVPRVEPRQAASKRTAGGAEILWWLMPLVLVAAVVGTLTGIRLEAAHGRDEDDEDGGASRRGSVMIESAHRRESLPLFGAHCASTSYETQHLSHTRARGPTRRCSGGLPL
jgi:hypothetical protein